MITAWILCCSAEVGAPCIMFSLHGSSNCQEIQCFTDICSSFVIIHSVYCSCPHLISNSHTDIQLNIMLLPSTSPQSHTWADMLSSVDTTHTVHTHIHTLTIHTSYKTHTHISHAFILPYYRPYTSHTTPTNTTQNTHIYTGAHTHTSSLLVQTVTSPLFCKAMCNTVLYKLMQLIVHWFHWNSIFYSLKFCLANQEQYGAFYMS